MCHFDTPEKSIHVRKQHVGALELRFKLHKIFSSADHTKMVESKSIALTKPTNMLTQCE